MYVILRYPRKQLQTRVGAVKSQSHEAQVSSKSQVFDVKSRVITGKSQSKSHVSKTQTRVGLESLDRDLINRFQNYRLICLPPYAIATDCRSTVQPVITGTAAAIEWADACICSACSLYNVRQHYFYKVICEIVKWLEESLDFTKNQHVVFRQAGITVPVNLQHQSCDWDYRPRRYAYDHRRILGLQIFDTFVS